jgi:nicotinamidase-related amidase
MTITIDKRTALRLMGKAVAEKGREHSLIGETCTYAKEFDRTKPQCIVGHVIHAAVGNDETFASIFADGVRVKTSGWSGTTFTVPANGAIFATSLTNYLDENDIHVTAGAAKVLEVAQTVQDGRGHGGRTWGHALDKAKSL